VASEPAPSDYRSYVLLVLAVLWLAGTYLAFLGLGQVQAVPDLLQLSMFIALTIAALIVGYLLEAHRRPKAEPRSAGPRTESIRRVTFWSGLYVAVYALAMLDEYGATSASSVIEAVFNPGAAYFSKFDIYAQQAGRDANLLIQILTLLAVLYVPLVPFTIVYWQRLTLAIKILAVLAQVLYVSFFFYIGTSKGLGDILIFTAVGLLVVQHRQRDLLRRKIIRRRVQVFGIVMACLFVAYMSFSQSQRISTAGVEGRFAPNPVVQSLTGEKFARGLSVTASYPTHGYLGLAYNLGTPFEWTGGRGGSRALDSYLAQYGVADSVESITYPARTEQRTGWPARMFWATAYPWLASDLTFPGVIIFMGVLGWWLSRLWRETVVGMSQLSLLLLCELSLFIAFIPANNQIGTSRPSLIGFLVLVGAYAFNRSHRRSREGGRLATYP